MVGTRLYGRMGNVLFQSAHTIALALKHGQEFSLPNRTNDPFWNPLYLQHLVNPKYIQGKEDVLINEHGMAYQEIQWKDEWKDKQVVLNGYWQSWKYTDSYRDEILYLFGYPYEMKEDTVAVHVRRGDYVRLPDKHILPNKEWYENAMSRFGTNFKYKFFSDDLQWCRENFGNRSDCEFSTNDDIEKDMIEGSCCIHQILSSSSYGWWMGWLNRNPNKIIYIPEKWFKDGWMGMDTRDVVPPSWYKI